MHAENSPPSASRELPEPASPTPELTDLLTDWRELVIEGEVIEGSCSAERERTFADWSRREKAAYRAIESLVEARTRERDEALRRLFQVERELCDEIKRSALRERRLP